MEKLSTGKRINSAGDDSAGLSISTRLKAQINASKKGTGNLNDAKSLKRPAPFTNKSADDENPAKPKQSGTSKFIAKLRLPSKEVLTFCLF